MHTEKGSGHLPLVYVVDDDEDIRFVLRRLLHSIGVETALFASPARFLEAFDPEQPGCVLCDLCMPEMDGIELQARLGAFVPRPTVLLMSAYGNISVAVQSIQAGAVDFLTKPLSPQQVIGRVQQALRTDQEVRSRHRRYLHLKQRYHSLSPREREVLLLLLQGRLNKAIAAELGISSRTVETHRAKLMEKLGATTALNLIQLVYELKDDFPELQEAIPDLPPSQIAAR